MEEKKKEDKNIQINSDAEKNESERKGQKSLYEVLEDYIVTSDLAESEKTRRLSYLLRLRNKKVNLLIVGPTGVGKSSTINALFNTEVAKVGVGVDPETLSLQRYELDNLTIWDTPGLGDNVDRDQKIKHDLVAKLNETVEGDKSLVDLVLVLVDASSKDLGTSYDLINNILIPTLGADAKSRIIVALNQADMAMKGQHWNREKNEPDEILTKFLDAKAISIRKRIKDATGLDLEPVYYCAGYIENGMERHPYNLTKLLYHIVKAIPADKRLVLMDNLSDKNENWKHDDGKKDYCKETVQDFFESVGNCICDCVHKGFDIGKEILGLPGGVVGGVIGALLGSIGGAIGTAFGKRYTKLEVPDPWTE